MTQTSQIDTGLLLETQIKKEIFFTAILVGILFVSTVVYIHIGRNYEENFIQTEEALSTS